MLTELSMKNFKSWKSIDNMRIAPITGLFGTNSSGKSSILQMLLLIKQSVESTDPTQVINLGDDRSPVRLGSFRDVVFGHEQQAPLKFAIKWKRERPDEEKLITAIMDFPDPIRTEFQSAISENPSDGVRVDEIVTATRGLRITTEKSQKLPGKYLFKVFTKSTGDKPYLEFDGQPAPERFDVPSIPAYLPGKNKDDLLAGTEIIKFAAKGWLSALFRGVFYLGPLRDRPQRTYQWRGIATSSVGYAGERAVDVMLTDRNARTNGNASVEKVLYKLLEDEVSAWLRKLGLSQGVELKPIVEGGDTFEIRIRSSAGTADVLLPDVGFGVSQVLPVIVLCCSAPKGSTIILEQPEIHLHPAAQSGLADLFTYAAKGRGVQVIFESHSEHLLRRLQRRIAEESLDPHQTALYFCEPGGAEGSKLNPLDVDPFGNIKNWPKDFFGDEFGEMAAMAKAAMERKMVQPS